MTSDEIGACVGARFTELRGYDQAQITAFVGEQVNAALEEAAGIAQDLTITRFDATKEIRALKIGAGK